VEAGTNLGSTLLRGNVIAPASSYIGFEPNPACVAYVEELLRENRIVGPRVFTAALGDQEGVGTLQFHHSDPADRTATLIPEYDQGQQVDRVLTVPVVRFDDVSQGLLARNVGVIRLDTNGGDLEALRGMRATLERDRPALILHLPPIYRATNTERLRRQELIEGELTKLGYALFRVHEDDRIIHVEHVPCPIGTHGELDWSNYIALHSDRVETILGAFHLVQGPQRYEPVLR
jgi:FkbM family methyltransferase